MIEVYKEIVKYVDEHIDEEITISDLSKATGYSRRHLYRLFKKYNDTSIMKYIRRKKLSAAADKVRSSMKMYEIALDYGYETPAGFYKAFQSIYGCSPSDYKNNMLRSKIMDNTRSIEELTQLIEREPNNAAFYLERGMAYYKDRQHDKAIEDCEKAISLDSKADAYRILGWSYSASNQPEKSLENWNKAIEFEPDFANGYIFRGNVYLRLNQSEKAIEDFTKAIDFAENKAQAYAQRGQMYSQLNQNDKAMDDYNKAIELHPNESWIYNSRAILYLQWNKLDKAIEDYTKAIELDPNTAYLYTNRASCYKRMNQHDKAEADYRKALEITSDSTDEWSYSNRGNSYMELKQYDKALENYTKALELNPDSDWIYFNRAYIYLQLKQYDKAILDYEKTIELDPEHVCPYESLAYTYLKSKQNEKAFEAYTKLAELIESKHSGNKGLQEMYAQTFLNRSSVYERLGEYDKAADFLFRAAEIDPDNAWCYYNLVNLCTYKYKGSYEKIKEYCTKSVEYFNRALGIYSEELGRRMAVRDERDWQTRIHRWRAACYEAMGMDEQAEVDYEKAIELESDKIYVYRFRISRYLESKKYDKAAEMAKKALAKNPAAPQSAVTRAYQYLIEMQPEKAIDELRKADELDPNNVEVGELLEALSD